MWKWYEIQVSAKTNKVLLAKGHALWFPCWLSLLLHYSGRAEKLWQRPVWPAEPTSYMALDWKCLPTPRLEEGDITSAQGHDEGSDASTLLFCTFLYLIWPSQPSYVRRDRKGRFHHSTFLRLEILRLGPIQRLVQYWGLTDGSTKSQLSHGAESREKPSLQEQRAHTRTHVHARVHACVHTHRHTPCGTRAS